MALIRYFLWFFCASSVLGQELHKLSIYPFDLKNDGTFEYPGSTNQLEYVDGVVYIRSEKEVFITLAKPSGQILQTIGKQGGGPGEFSGYLKTMAIGPGHFFALSSSPIDRLFHFAGETYLGYIPVAVLSHSFISGTSSKKIDVSATHVVLPAPPQSGHLGFAYDFEGNRTPVGTLIYNESNVSV